MDLYNQLKLVLYTLYYVDDPVAFAGLTTSQKKAYKRDYSPQELRRMHESLKWGLANEQLNFSRIWPELKFSDKQIYNYIKLLDRDFTDMTDEE